MPADRTPYRALWRAAAYGVAASLPVLALAWLVRAESGVVVDADRAAVAAATRFAGERPALERALLVGQEALAARWMNLAAMGVCVWAWRRHGLGPRAAWAAGTIWGAWALGLGAKEVVGRARPVLEDAVSTVPGASFPSGHAMNAAAVGVTLSVLVWPLLGRRGRVAVVGGATALALVTAADRVLLGAHYPSDVVGGILLGGAVAGASAVGFHGWTAARSGRPSGDTPRNEV
ncbi:phosphatase PAP2 family protein [Cellulosimicrobium cellulans]|uniref:phosphatase PAP2 family protein n=1 Tax=Cellulosimicrobium TaxID=157920 RepID=UPI00087EA1D8|nr:phosphatase PAP2 family protein [Sphaerisporangium cinnabarinum]MCR1983663.1 phosphatase PAP2 family protein [Cellulosimicrobium cellulans]PTU54454.1 phosphatase PAP2 family protein [Sphaerisporangium cinnabarinum]SDF07726.1 undecaprenyl-diphosphatase [Cellulosimicrobium cellulans]